MRSRAVLVATWLLSLLLAGALGWQLHAVLGPKPEPEPARRTFETRDVGGRREVFAKGRWRTLVERTAEPFTEFVPGDLTPGEVVHLNADGTACLTDERDAAKRSQFQVQGKPGWPHTSWDD